MLELMAALWLPDWTEFDGGLSETALRRAARHDGWIGDLITTRRLIFSRAKQSVPSPAHLA
jgi:hypothetical protein